MTFINVSIKLNTLLEWCRKVTFTLTICSNEVTTTTSTVMRFEFSTKVCGFRTIKILLSLDDLDKLCNYKLKGSDICTERNCQYFQVRTVRMFWPNFFLVREASLFTVHPPVRFHRCHVMSSIFHIQLSFLPLSLFHSSQVEFERKKKFCPPPSKCQRYFFCPPFHVDFLSRRL